jgi:hypothetical protein
MKTIMENSYINVSVEYQSKVLEAFQDVEAPMFKRVWEYLWNDGTYYANVRRPYRVVMFDQGRLEFNIPVAPNLNYSMEYHRVSVKVLTHVDEDSVREAIAEMMKPITSPAGRVRSFTLFIIAPEGCKPIIKGGRISREGFLYVVVDPVPENAVIRAFKLFLNHLVKRLKGFIRSLKLEEWMVDEYFKNREQSLLTSLIEKYRLSIRRIFDCFVKTMDWIAGRVQELEKRLKAVEEFPKMRMSLEELVNRMIAIIPYLPPHMIPFWIDLIHRLKEEMHAERVLKITEAYSHGLNPSVR